MEDNAAGMLCDLALITKIIRGLVCKETVAASVGE